MQNLTMEQRFIQRPSWPQMHASASVYIVLRLRPESFTIPVLLLINKSN